jgi:hypothetical protein
LGPLQRRRIITPVLLDIVANDTQTQPKVIMTKKKFKRLETPASKSLISRDGWCLLPPLKEAAMSSDKIDDERSM